MRPVHNQLTLDVNAEKSSAIIVAKAEDDRSRYLDINLTCNGDSIIPGGSDRVVLMAADNNTNQTVAAIDGTISDGIITVELTKSLLAVPTTLRCELIVYGTAGTMLTSPTFYVVVTARIDSTVIERENDFSALLSALGDVASTSNRIDEVAARVQPIELGGTGATDKVAAAQALQVASLAVAAAIAENDDLDLYLTPGTYNATRSVALTLTHCPLDGAFKLYVMEQWSGYFVQLLIGCVSNVIWFRGCTSPNTFSGWRKILTTDTLAEESGTWVPTPESGSISAVTASYIYDGRRITATAKFTCGDDVTTSLLLTGLPIAARTKSAGSVVVMGTAAAVSVIASEAKLQLKSGASMAGQTIIITITYGVL